MKNSFLIFALIALTLVLVVTYVPGVSKRFSEKIQTTKVTNQVVLQQQKQISDRQKIKLSFPSKQLVVEAVTTDASITQGLSGRDAIGSDGMLFVFAQRHIPRFWMKEMKFGLDFVWIDGEKVVDITQNVPPPASGQALSDLPLYSPQTPITYVLEVNAGMVNTWGIRPGDMVKIE